MFNRLKRIEELMAEFIAIEKRVEELVVESRAQYLSDRLSARAAVEMQKT